MDYLKRALPEDERKLQLLLCLDELRLCTAEELWPFVTGLGPGDYFSFCMDLDGLRLSGDLAGSRALYLTAQGRRTLRLFGKRVMPSVRRRIREEAPPYRRALQEKKQTPVRAESSADGLCRVEAQVLESDLPTLSLSLETRDKALYRAFSENFREKVPSLLVALYSLPLENVSPAEEGAVTPCPDGFFARAGLETGSTRLSLTLLMQSEENARRWAGAVNAGGEPLLERLRALMEEKA